MKRDCSRNRSVSDVTSTIDELEITSDAAAYALTRSNGTQIALATGDQSAESNR